MIRYADFTQMRRPKLARPSGGSPCVHSEPEWVHWKVEFAIRRARDGGRPLEGFLREQMNPGLASYLRDVRVHTDPEADELNQQLRAKAFTIGSDIFFEQGAYDPTSLKGQKLLIHELVHVVQQKSRQVISELHGMSVRPANDAFEEEADSIAGQVSVAGIAQAFANLYCTKERYALNSLEPRRDYQSFTIQRRAQDFANCAKIAPPIPTAAHPLRGVHTCHEAALYWELKCQGYDYPDRLLEAIVSETRIGIGTCIPPAWYERLYEGAQTIDGREQLRAKVKVGDVLITGIASNPSHTMVVVKNSKSGLRWRTFIRGFNNFGTLGTGPAAAYGYDNNDRDIDKDKFWHQNNRFGLHPAAAMPLLRVPYTMYQPRVRTVAFNDSTYDPANNSWTYNYAD